jgi:hypothetical protein
MTKESTATVYNFVVTDDHSYFVGGKDRVSRKDKEWLWVHNGPLYDCTNIAQKLIKKRGSGEIMTVIRQGTTSDDVLMFSFNSPYKQYSFGYHDVVHDAGMITDTFTFGHSNPTPMAEWKSAFDMATHGTGSGFDLDFQLVAGSGRGRF